MSLNSMCWHDRRSSITPPPRARCPRFQPARSETMQRKWILTIAIAALAAAGCSGQDEPPPPKRTPVRVHAATTGPATPPIRTTGVVATKDEMRLSFKVGGVIKSIHVQQGEEVRQGQRLAEIE